MEQKDCYSPSKSHLQPVHTLHSLSQLLLPNIPPSPLEMVRFENMNGTEMKFMLQGTGNGSSDLYEVLDRAMYNK